MTKNQRRLRRNWAATVACSAMVFAGTTLTRPATTHAAPASPPTPPPSRPERPERPDRPNEPPKPAEFPPLKPIIGERLPAVEKELAALIMRRSSTSAAGIAQLEMAIDVRIIHRWILQLTLAARGETPEQIVGLLRADQFAQAIGDLEETLRQLGAKPPTRTQSEALVRLHQISYDLKPDAAAQGLDEVCRSTAYAMINIVSPTPIDAAQIPQMRPVKIDVRKGPRQEAGEQRTLAMLGDEITHAAVSVPVRSQLLALLAETQNAQNTGDKEAGKLAAVLPDAVDLAKGLAGNVAMSAQTKADIETEFAEGLALFSDPRTRSSGQGRIQGLAQYRQMMARIGRMKIAPELRNKLNPVVAWSQNHVEQGGRVLGLIDQFLEITGQFEATPRGPGTMPNLRNATAEAAKAFEQKRDAFLGTAAEMTGTATSANADGLEVAVGEMRLSLDLYQTIAYMPQAVEILNLYKPKPFGGLEQRVVKAGVVATNPVKSPMVTSAKSFLADVAKLARSAEAVGLKSMADLPAAVVTAWAGGPLNEFETRCRTIVAELASQAAAGSDLDAKKMARLEAVPQLVGSLRAAVALEGILTRGTPLRRWVDWDLTPDALRAMLTPYQQAVAAAFAGFVGDTPDTVEKFLRARGQFVPLMAMTGRDAAYIDACARFPTGLVGSVARLATPLDGQPFATERYVSFALKVSTLYSGTDLDAARAASSAALRRLARDVKPTPEEQFGPPPVNIKTSSAN